MMESTAKTYLTVNAHINAPLNEVWEKWTNPVDIVNWNNASDDWHTPQVVNELKIGGKFIYHMAAKDGSQGFDFVGTYTQIENGKLIEYIIADGRKVSVTFIARNEQCFVEEVFEAEKIHSPELQKDGWQAILNNFKKYVESGQSS